MPLFLMKKLQIDEVLEASLTRQKWKKACTKGEHMKKTKEKHTAMCAYAHEGNQHAFVRMTLYAYAQVPAHRFINEARGSRIWGSLGPIFGVLKPFGSAISKGNEDISRH
ncbi:uncharacterized protein DS421_9g271580 [Arachis hypogaea]|nr:uncharacterized protein DS421_9g271580 [Arachis hypogaea]